MAAARSPPAPSEILFVPKFQRDHVDKRFLMVFEGSTGDQPAIVGSGAFHCMNHIARFLLLESNLFLIAGGIVSCPKRRLRRPSKDGQAVFNHVAISGSLLRLPSRSVYRRSYSALPQSAWGGWWQSLRLGSWKVLSSLS